MRLIDADAFVEKMNGLFTSNCYGGCDAGGFIQALCDAPTTDLESLVKRGRWVLTDDGHLRCSNCTQEAPLVWQEDGEPITTATFYCPHCGRKMTERNT